MHPWASYGVIFIYHCLLESYTSWMKSSLSSMVISKCSLGTCWNQIQNVSVNLIMKNDYCIVFRWQRKTLSVCIWNFCYPQKLWTTVEFTFLWLNKKYIFEFQLCVPHVFTWYVQVCPFPPHWWLINFDWNDIVNEHFKKQNICSFKDDKILLKWKRTQV